MTVMDEQLFPRGGKAHSHKKEGAPKKRKTESLFKNSAIKKKKKRLRKKKFNPKDLETELTTKKEKKNAAKERDALPSVEPFIYKALTEGMNVLSKIQEVRKLEILLSLPGRMQAIVPIADISAPYTALLNNLNEESEVKGLDELFKAGMVLPCNIKQVSQDGSYKVFASLNPADIITDIPLSSLAKGMKVAAAVQSIEDHGYVMDIGMTGVRSFMVKENEQDLAVGQVIQCFVTECQVDGHVATLTLSLNTTIKFKQNVELNVSTLIPGTKLHVNIRKVTTQGLMVSIGNLTGYIHKDHLAKPMDDMSEYSKNPNLVAVVLYTLPLVNAVYLSLRPSLVDPGKAGDAERIDIGRIFDSAVVMESTSAGLFVQLKKKILGFIPLRHLDDKHDAIEDIKAHHPVKSHKRCRVLQYSSFDGIYICTMKKSLLNQKALRYEDFTVGQLIEATIDSVLATGITVDLGVNLRGFIPKLHWADDPRLKRPELRFKPGTTVTCRVLKYNSDRRSLLLTCKKSLVADNQPVYHEFSQLTKKATVKGTVALVEKGGILVAFYAELTGWIPFARLEKRGLSNQHFFLGQVIDCVVENVDSETGKVVLDLEKSDIALAGAEVRLGEVVQCRVEKVNAGESNPGLEVSIPEMKTNGFIPMEHLSDFPQLCRELLTCYQPGDAIDEAILWQAKKNETMLTLKASILSFAKDNRFPRSYDEIGVNSIFPCVSMRKQDFGVFASLLCPPSSVDVLCPKTKMSRSLFESFSAGLKHLTMEGKVLSVDAEKKKVALSILKADCPQHPAETLDSFFQDMNRISKKLTNSTDEKLKYLAKLKLGDSAVGKTLSVDPSIGVEFELPHGLRGIVPTYHLAEKNFKVNDIVVGAILFTDVLTQTVYVTTRTEIVKAIAGGVTSTAPIDQQLKATTILNLHLFSIVLINDGKIKDIAYTSNMMNLNESSAPMPSPFPVGDTVIVVVSSTASGRIACYHQQPKTWKRKNDAHDAPSKKKQKKNATQKEAAAAPAAAAAPTVPAPALEDEADKGTENKKKKKTKKEKKETKPEAEEKEKEKPAGAEELVKKPVKSVEKAAVKKVKEPLVVKDISALPRLQVSSAFVWDEDEMAEPKKADDCSSSDSEEDEDDTSDGDKMVTKDRRERAKQKLEKARLDELKLSIIEENLTDPDRTPVTADDFDRMIVGSPNSSILWLHYIAFHLENADIEKARVVAQRALKTINFREEQEKFNVWIAWLNLENTYGTTEAYDQLFEEALRCNEPIKVYRQMALNFEKNGKIDEAESLYNTMQKKFKDDKSVWLNACLFYIKNAKLSTARNVFQKALLSLEKREHVHFISRFAQLELKYGEAERGKTMFDTLMISYPKRTDLWLVYVDALIKAEQIDSSRQVLERCITLQLPAKKMKTLFQKFLEFETRHGSEERQTYVRQKALEYVESKTETAE